VFRTALLLFALAIASLARGQEIPLETCGRLPVVQVSVSGMKFLFLVDTGATSMLNLSSFAHGDARRISVTSWNGTVEAKAQEVTVADLAIGQQHFRDLRLPAADLSAIGRACGRSIDGILGIDLLGRLGANLDLKGPNPRLLVETDNFQARVAEMERQLSACAAAFNRADEAAFAECFEPQVVVFAAGGDFYGREAIMAYYRERYFKRNPPAHLVMTPRAHHPIGDAIWMEYDLRVTLGDHVLVVARGTALCQKTGGQWRVAHMNHSNPVDAPAQALK